MTRRTSGRDNTVRWRPFRRWRAIGFLMIALVCFDAGAPAPDAQTPHRLYRVGFLGQTTARDLDHQPRALRQGLRDLGYPGTPT